MEDSASPHPRQTHDRVISRPLRALCAARLKTWWCRQRWTPEVPAFGFRPGSAFHTGISQLDSFALPKP